MSQLQNLAKPVGAFPRNAQNEKTSFVSERCISRKCTHAKVLQLPLMKMLLSVKLDGRGFGLLNGREAFYFPDGPGTSEIPAGTNTVEFRVFNRERVPSVCVKGGIWTSDGSWEADDDTKRWVPAETFGMTMSDWRASQARCRKLRKE